MESHIEPARLRAAFGHFATGVAVITAAGESGQCAGMTINSFASLIAQPATHLMEHRQILRGVTPCFTAAAEFAIHVLRADQAELSRQFSTPGADRFRGVAFECTPRGIRC